LSAYKRIRVELVDKELLLEALNLLKLSPCERDGVIHAVGRHPYGTWRPLSFPWNEARQAFDVEGMDLTASDKAVAKVKQAYALAGIARGMRNSRFANVKINYDQLLCDEISDIEVEGEKLI
jgi:hypothetical protein